MPGEFDWINWVLTQQKTSPLVQRPAGDDLAALHWPQDELLLVGVDQVLEGVHFDRAVHSPRQIGIKAMNRNLSDCAAMGCLPAAAVASVALPSDMTMEQIKELYLGMKQAGDVYYCPIVGGDTGSWDGPLALTVTILGRSAGVTPVGRDGDRPGDGIYVTGPLGGSLLGRHMTFEPRVHLGRQLAQYAHLTSMIDLSDGLSRDLRHICTQSGTGAILDADKIPIHPDAHALSQSNGRSPLEHALHDGEDYELLFTTGTAIPPAGIKIGTVTESKELLLIQNGRTVPLPPKGWEHNISG
jgi:thiamine-monophosphate kinase